MNSSFGDNETSMRERELEVEIARLNAEIETLRGEAEPTDSAARFLAMAASTVDQAMEDARREADEFAAEVSAEAEARRDEATRIAEEAEVRAQALREEADQSETVVRQAELDAGQIRAAAEQEAAELVTAERTRLADELEVLSGVRAALEEERGALESYHEELQRRVQELAESMVNFMTTEPPIGAVRAIDDLAAPALGAADAEADEPVSGSDEPVPMSDDTVSDGDDTISEGDDTVSDDDETVSEGGIASDGGEADAEVAVVEAVDAAVEATFEPAVEPAAELEVDAAAGETIADESSTDDGAEAAAEMAFVDYVIEPAGDVPPAPDVPEPAPAPPSFQDTAAPSPADHFDGVPVVDDPGDEPPATVRGGLFGRATDDEQQGSAGLFGSHGAQLIEQTSPQDLAAALADEDAEDERFRSFIDGDDDADPSRDWLLRPEQH